MKHAPLLASMVGAGLLLTGPAAGAPPEPNPLSVGAIPGGQLSIDQATPQTRRDRRHGWRRIEATIQLNQPVIYAAREITQEVQTQEWDCDSQRYRVILRVFRTAGGEFVRSERELGPWSAVPETGAEHRAFEAICPEVKEGEVVPPG